MSTSPRSTSSAGWSRRSSATTRSARSPTPASSCRPRSTRTSGSWSASTTSPRATTAQLPILRIDPALERKQIGRIQAVRARRDGAAVERALAALKTAAAHEHRNLMPNLLDCARVHATEGEIVDSPPRRLRHLHRDTRLLTGHCQQLGDPRELDARAARRSRTRRAVSSHPRRTPGRRRWG